MSQSNIEIQPQKDSSSLIKITRWLALIFVIALTIYIITISTQIEIFMDEIPGLGWLAYPSIFAVSIVVNATVLVPIPGVALTTAFGAIFNPYGVALAAGLGASLGELSGYLAGYSGQGIIENSKWRDRLFSWMETNGSWTILVLAFIPNPLFDMAGMIAGALKMRITRFLFWCSIGKILKMLLFALAGNWVSRLF
ncbi:MAG: VTT domain-containing protein [Anaerolineaceae bacterium]|nr:VTT domain-containing protein [Anaerolineaceae bacterium]